MKAKVIKIGNSKGVRLPKAILEESGIGNEVTLEASRGAVIIKSDFKPRSDWNDEFSKMAKNGDDRLLETADSTWDEWEWK